ncbi:MULTISPECIES: AAA family ATPase [Streptomyces]|uniref:AAA family ATPase n=1 Tax=Streptomyces TaxID=1883 RepID=UPI000517A80C|nr:MULTISPECIES: AAA family ATPase [Streptomyces]MDX2917331.1 AAA family ATPase [Streptomyces sp. NE06-03C]MDX3605490.1 AAA family ATPase [Streptomyces sp. FL06-04B]MDX3736426.1 AAA family ATPase [Streptomyces sp. ID01-15D]
MTATAPVVVVTGIPGSGKSTVGALLAERFDRAVLIEGDVLRRMVVTGRAEMSPEREPEALLQYGLRLRHLAFLARSYAAAGFPVVAEDNIIGTYLEEFVAMLGDTLTVHVVVLAPRAEVAGGRDAGRTHHAYGEGGWGADALDAAFRDETPRLGHWLDTSDQSAAETVEEIWHLLKLGVDR